MIDWVWRKFRDYCSCGKGCYFPHLVLSVDRSLCYVNKEYNLGILKGIILWFMCVTFLVQTRNKIKLCALVWVSAVLTSKPCAMMFAHVNIWE